MTIDLTPTIVPLFAALTALAVVAATVIAAVGSVHTNCGRSSGARRRRDDVAIRCDRPPEAGAA